MWVGVGVDVGVNVGILGLSGVGIGGLRLCVCAGGWSHGLWKMYYICICKGELACAWLLLLVQYAG